MRPLTTPRRPSLDTSVKDLDPNGGASARCSSCGTYYVRARDSSSCRTYYDPGPGSVTPLTPYRRPANNKRCCKVRPPQALRSYNKVTQCPWDSYYRQHYTYRCGFFNWWRCGGSSLRLRWGWCCAILILSQCLCQCLFVDRAVVVVVLTLFVWNSTRSKY